MFWAETKLFAPQNIDGCITYFLCMCIYTAQLSLALVRMCSGSLLTSYNQKAVWMSMMNLIKSNHRDFLWSTFLIRYTAMFHVVVTS